MKFDDNVKKHIKEYFDNISAEELARLLVDKYHMKFDESNENVDYF